MTVTFTQFFITSPWTIKIVTPISAAQTNSPQHLMETEADHRHTIPEQHLNTQLVKTKILEIQETISKLTTHEMDCQTEKTSIQSFMKNKAIEAADIKNKKKLLKETIEMLENNIQEITLSAKNDTPLITKINNANREIEDSLKTINDIKTKIRNTEENIHRLLESKNQKNEEIKNTKEKKESLNLKTKELEKKEKNTYEEIINIENIGDLQNSFENNINKLIKDIYTSTQKLKTKNNTEEIIEEYKKDAKIFINKELIKKIKSKKRNKQLSRNKIIFTRKKKQVNP